MASFLSDDTVRVRSDGTTRVNPSDPKDKRTYPAWPDDSFVTLRETVTSGDEEYATEQSYHMVSVTDPSGERAAENRLEYKFWSAKLITVALMAESFEGSAFEDPRTGTVLDMSGDFPARLEQIRRLPPRVIRWIDAKVAELNNDPLAPPKGESGSETGSGRPSTRSSTRGAAPTES